jgi:hypothetical protein
MISAWKDARVQKGAGSSGATDEKPADGSTPAPPSA